MATQKETRESRAAYYKGEREQGTTLVDQAIEGLWELHRLVLERNAEWIRENASCAVEYRA